MNSFDVAKWLNEECSDEEFVEVFAYLSLMESGRKITEDHLTKDYLLSNFNIRSLTDRIETILDEVIFSEQVDTSAWWKIDD